MSKVLPPLKIILENIGNENKVDMFGDSLMWKQITPGINLN